MLNVQMRETELYLVVKPKSYFGLSARVSTRVPALQSDEVAIKVNVKVPNMLFKRPQLQAQITVPDTAVSAPVINAEVLDNVREVLSKQFGVDMSIQLVEASE